MLGAVRTIAKPFTFEDMLKAVIEELCWHHPALWGLLPEKQDPLPVVPEWPEFIRGCVRGPG